MLAVNFLGIVRQKGYFGFILTTGSFDRVMSQVRVGVYLLKRLYRDRYCCRLWSG